MALPPWIRVVGSTLVGCAVLKLAAAAEACSPPFCTSPVRLPTGARMAGDHFYFQLLVPDPGVLSLHTTEGEPIAASIRSIGNDRVFAPEQPIAAGTSVVLELANECSLEGVPQSYEILAEPHGSIELDPAQLQVLEQGTAYSGVPGDEASFVRVRHSSGDLNGVATPLMTHTFTVDGVPAQLGEVNGQQVVEVSARCHPAYTENQIDTCGVVYSVAPGVHTVEARTTIVGEVTQPEPVRLKVEVRCADDSAKVAPDDPEGMLRDDITDPNSDANFYRPTAARDTARMATPIEAEGATPDVVSASSRGGGCALALRPPQAAGSTLAAGLGALLLLTSVARRRNLGKSKRSGQGRAFDKPT